MLNLPQVVLLGMVELLEVGHQDWDVQLHKVPVLQEEGQECKVPVLQDQLEGRLLLLHRKTLKYRTLVARFVELLGLFVILNTGLTNQ